MTPEAQLSMASAALERLGARLVHVDHDAVTVEGGMGLRKRRLDVPLAPLRAFIAAHPERERTAIASYFRGVGSVVLEPRLSRREASLEFAQAAGRLMPSLEGPLFLQGAQLAAPGTESGEADAFFGETTLGDLWIAHFVELDTGRRLVTRSMLDAWDVSDDRTVKAALSLLFHRSYEVAPREHPVSGVPDCQAFQVGDSYDATRSLILDNLLYQRALKGLLIAMPSPDTCLLTALPEPDDTHVLDAFAAEVDALYGQSAWSLSRALYRVKVGPPVEISR
jgi:hypothetical protein